MSDPRCPSKLPGDSALNCKRLPVINTITERTLKILYIEQVSEVKYCSESIAFIENRGISPKIAGYGIGIVKVNAITHIKQANSSP